jgi:hypothetical protein
MLQKVSSIAFRTQTSVTGSSYSEARSSSFAPGHVFVLKRNSTGRFNLVDCLHDFASAVTIHGDDVLAHANWEIGESWLRRYGFVNFSPVIPSR